MSRRAAIRVIGIGNGWRGDDAVGLFAAQRLRSRLDPTIEVIATEGDGLALLDLMEGADQVVLIDEARSGSRPGEIVRLDLSTHSRWESVVPCSTHAWSLAEAIDLARTLGRLPVRVVFYGLVIEASDVGTSLSHSARTGLNELVELVTDEIAKALCTKHI